MKKTVLIAAAFVGASAVSAQTGEITSNRGENWLSQDGDWGLTFDAQPVLQYVGNLFNNGSNGENTIELRDPFGNTSGVVIGAKKLVDANTAYRGLLRIGYSSHRMVDVVHADPQPDVVPTPPNTVEDVTRTSNMDIVIGAGLEKRIGSTRVVGVYGGQIFVALSNERTTYDYGNAIYDNFNGGFPPSVLDPRVTEERRGSMFGFGLQGFAGVEWFFAPKMSLGGEYTWGLQLQSQGFGETTEEYWDPSLNDGDGALVTVTHEGNPAAGTNDRNSTFSLDTGISGARILLNFYFQ